MIPKYEHDKHSFPEDGYSIDLSPENLTMSLIKEIVDKVLLVDARNKIGMGKVVEIRATIAGVVNPRKLAWYTNQHILKSAADFVDEPVLCVDGGFLYCGRFLL